MTAEFIEANFGKKNFDDIIYITSNPFVNLLAKNKFYRIVSVWINGWDSSINTVLPETINKYVLEELPKYPNKRFIIHYIQPHYPFIGFSLPEETGIKNFRESVMNNTKLKDDIEPWKFVESRKAPLERIILAYKNNLRIVMDSVEKLLPYLYGKIIITSDHEGGFGEPLHKLFPIKVYGHLRRVRTEYLVKVPWFVINKNN